MSTQNTNIVTSKSKKKHQKFTAFGFILAAIGSAVGLGNIWGFPTKLMNHGGPAFLIPYMIGIFCIGFPLLLLELNLGSKWRTSPVMFYGNYLGGFGKPLAWLQAALLLGISCYYAILISWVINSGIVALFDLESLAVGTYFDDHIFGSGDIKDDLAAAKNNWLNPFGSVQIWVLIGFAFAIFATFFVVLAGISNGIETVNKILVPALFVIFIAFFLFSIRLPGASTGMHKIFYPDWSKLKDGAAWSSAFGHALFSIGLCTSIIIIYSSRSPVTGSNAIQAIVILSGDTLIALIACGVVGSALGYGLNEGSDHIFVSFYKLTEGSETTAFATLGAISETDLATTLGLGTDSSLVMGAASKDLLAPFVDGDALNIITGEFTQIDPESIKKFGGSGVIFEAFPKVFYALGGTGVKTTIWPNLLAFIFYLGIFAAAFSSIIALFEPMTESLQQQYKISRLQGAAFCAAFSLMFGFWFAIPSTTGVWDSMTDGFIIKNLLLLMVPIETLMIAASWSRLQALFPDYSKRKLSFIRLALFVAAGLAILIFIYGIYGHFQDGYLFSSGVFNEGIGSARIKYYLLAVWTFIAPVILIITLFTGAHIWFSRFQRPKPTTKRAKNKTR